MIFWSDSIMHSYSQVFFSQHKLFAAIIILVTFVNLYAGLAGLIAVLTANLLAYAMGFSKLTVQKGLYGFNALLVGLGMGVYYTPGKEFYLILLIGAMLTFFITIAMEGMIGKYTLPYLSMPFLIGIWVMILATRQFNALGISEIGLYEYNDIYVLGGRKLLDLYIWWNELPIGQSLRTYFISLSAIFFQYGTMAGILIAIGLLLYSRIAFTLSLIGFYTAWYFYGIIGAEITELGYSYIGFNYILTSIAVGGFFIIPGRQSYLWAVLLTPLVAIMLIATSRIFWTWSLPVYSLPFNVVVLMFLYALKLRLKPRGGLVETPVQENSPERNLYSYSINRNRLPEDRYLPLYLPYHGQWEVMQAHDGEHTHKDAWRHAWDFIMTDDEWKSYKDNGGELSHYYCYDKPVCAPADGIIETIENNVPDNAPGDMNLEQNWGNTIVISHAYGLYTQLSHLKADSFKVNEGDIVKQGQVLAAVGNSGRSPEPHLHFQVQATPQVGSATKDYPLASYISQTNGIKALHYFTRPEKGENISNIQVLPTLRKALHLIPGQKLKMEYQKSGNSKTSEWEVKSNSFNQQWIECLNSNDKAYFRESKGMFYFIHYQGRRSSALYHYYLAFYKSLQAYYDKMEIHDRYPVNTRFYGLARFVHDFVAPFHMFLRSDYRQKHLWVDDEFSPRQVELETRVSKSLIGREYHSRIYQIKIGRQGHKEIVMTENGKEKGKIVCVEDSVY